MKTFEERYADWLESRMSPEEAEAFEAELPAPSTDELAQMEVTAAPLGSLLRTQAVPPMGHGDFFNHQLRQRLEAEERATRPAEPVREKAGFRWPLAHLAWAGVCCLLGAAVLYQAWILPQAPREHALAAGATPVPNAPLVAAAAPPRDAKATEKMVASTEAAPGTRATILEAHAGDATVYASTVDNEAVVWLDGLEFLPANYPLQ